MTYTGKFCVSCWLLLLFLLLSVFSVVSAAPKADRVRRLPGLWTRINFRQYSGYLSASDTKKLHYWFVESQHNPSTDPVVLWLNGGPGCSSLEGILDENGPFRVRRDGRTIMMNPHSWNKIANVLYLEAPAGVGFSYSTDHNYATNDDQVADDNFQALKDFFQLFPEYADNDFYLTGESYAGVYVPTLASRVMDDPSFQFKGFVVGNGITDWEMLNDALIYYAFSHGLIGQSMWQDIVKKCCSRQNQFRCPFHETAQHRSSCNELLTQVHHIVDGIGINPYNLFGTCDGGVPDSDGVITSMSVAANQPQSTIIVIALPVPLSILSDAYHRVKVKLKELLSLGNGVDLMVPCTNSSHLTTYLNSPKVRNALHIPREVGPWGLCSSMVSAEYEMTYQNVRAEYLKVLDKGHRILVYNGDADMACNFLGDQWFVDSLQQKEVQGYREWYYRKDGSRQIGGFVHQYENINFITVRGAGHMVPTDRPEQAFTMFEKFIKNQPF